MSRDGSRPSWDEEFARRLVGKRVIVGLTRFDADGNLLEQRQFHGEIADVAHDRGIAIRVAGRSDLYWLPPDLRSFRLAPPGEYRLRATSEVVVNPDLMATWTVTAPRVH